MICEHIELIIHGYLKIHILLGPLWLSKVWEATNSYCCGIESLVASVVHCIAKTGKNLSSILLLYRIFLILVLSFSSRIYGKKRHFNVQDVMVFNGGTMLCHSWAYVASMEMKLEVILMILGSHTQNTSRRVVFDRRQWINILLAANYCEYHYLKLLLTKTIFTSSSLWHQKLDAASSNSFRQRTKNPHPPFHKHTLTHMLR